MSDDPNVTDNMTIWNEEGTKSVTVTTDGAKERLDVDAKVTSAVNPIGDALRIGHATPSATQSVAAATETDLISVSVPSDKIYNIHKWHYGSEAAGKAGLFLLTTSGDTTFIDDMEDVTDWTPTPGGHTISLNTDGAFITQGSGSMKSEYVDTPASGTYDAVKTYGSVQDWSGSTSMSIDVYRDERDTEFTIKLECLEHSCLFLRTVVWT